MAVSVEEEEALRTLYDAGLSDREAAIKLGLKRQTVTSWRNRKKLPVNRDKDFKRKTSPQVYKGTNLAKVRSALPADQVPQMLTFLWAVDQYRRHNRAGTYDIAWFMEQYCLVINGGKHAVSEGAK